MTAGKPELNLKLAMRKLWEEHIAYTRNYITSALANTEDTATIAQRLLSNQNDIGNALKTYYGDAAGKRLTALLRQHVSIIIEIMKVASINNNESLNKANKRWHANAQEIAVFLNEVNPNWPTKNMAEILHEHLNLTAGQIVSRLKKDWIADIGCYDRGHDHIIMLADTLTDGIIKQFPDKFK
jgi:hypothetical protein